MEYKVLASIIGNYGNSGLNKFYFVLCQYSRM